MKNGWVLAAALLLLGGCLSSPIPEGYSGPIATVSDTAISETSNRAQFFYLGEIDGQRIDNVLFTTRARNSGRGAQLTTAQFSRDVPAKPLNLVLEGRIDYGAPIEAIVNRSTVVRGVLTAERQEVWLEDAVTGQRIE